MNSVAIMGITEYINVERGDIAHISPRIKTTASARRNTLTQGMEAFLPIHVYNNVSRGLMKRGSEPSP